MAAEIGVSDWQQLDAPKVRMLLARSKRAGLGPASLALRMSRIAQSSWTGWYSQGVLSANPAKGISTPRSPKHLPKNLDVDEVE